MARDLTGAFHASAFGMLWDADIALDHFTPVSAVHGFDRVVVRRVAQLPDRHPTAAVHRGFVYTDGFRFPWYDEAIFDLIGGSRINYLPGPGWRGTMPASFYSTVAALTLAWRGDLTFHACAVEIDDRAFLIAGPSGAGKSTLTAALVAAGAQFIGDDLTVVRYDGAGTTATVSPGRPALRLHRATAKEVDATACSPVADDARGKWLARPCARSRSDRLPLGGVLILGAHSSTPPIERPGLLSAQLFRRRWLNHLPGRAERTRRVMELSASVPLAGFPAIATFDHPARSVWAREAMTLIQRMPGVHA